MNDWDRPARLGVFVSGSGRTMVNLHELAERGDAPFEVALVVASRDCGGEEKARSFGLPTLVTPGELSASALESTARASGLDLIVLAGYLRKIGVPASLKGRVINIHPALLPGDGSPGRFGGKGMYGDRVHKAVIDSGESESGCTVHVVGESYDDGPVLARASCPVETDDTPDMLAARVFALELDLYPRAIMEHLNEIGPKVWDSV